MTKRALCVFLGSYLVIVAGCGGGSGSSPTSPTTPTQKSYTLRVVNGLTKVPVSGAMVTAFTDTSAKVSGTTDANGNVTISMTADSTGKFNVDIEAAGFLNPYQTKYASQAEFNLWPMDGYDEMFIKQLVYCDVSANSSWITPGTDRRVWMLRMDTSKPFSLYFEGGLEQNQMFVEAARYAGEKLTEATEGVIRFVGLGEPLTKPVDNSFGIWVRVDPNKSGSYANTTSDRGLVKGGGIMFGSGHLNNTQPFVNNVAAHELGHIFGLGHTNASDGIMANGLPILPTAFSPREVVVMRMMLLRKPQSEFVDNERGANVQW